ncbi:hypothetical protein GCM10009799_09020 [Nocardiopsis rhodophaea]|uniref:Uncharacterized protein n=1 Tax=Nocardiopsis rhodophaea TaxID=280238 RepID=A0ABP5DV64_9ACTN
MTTTRSQVDIQFDTVLQLDYARSEVGLRLPDGSTERVMMETACPTEFIMHDLVESGEGMRMDLEIIRFELVGTSKELWPGERITVLGGALSAPDARPIVGAVDIPAGRTLEEGLRSEQVLYLTIQTPLGTLHNETPIRMVGDIYRVPPIGSRFESQGDVPLVDAEGVERLQVWACANEA